MITDVPEVEVVVYVVYLCKVDSVLRLVQLRYPVASHLTLIKSSECCAVLH